MKTQLYLFIIIVLSSIFSTSANEIDHSLYYYKIENTNSKIIVQNLEFKKFPESKSLGYKNGIYWLKLVLDKNINKENLVIYIPTHNIDKIDLYKLKNNHLDYISSSGNSISKKLLPIDYKFPAFKINVQKNNIFYLKVVFPKEANFPLKVDTEKDFLSFSLNKKTINSLYYGTALIIILFNLILYFKFNDKNHLYYSLFLLSLILNFLYFDGSLIDIFRGNYFYYLLEFLVHISEETFLILFSVSFLNLKTKCPNFVKTINYIPLIILVAYISFILTEDYIIAAIADVFGISLFPVLWILGIYFIKEVPNAKYYVLGYLLLFPLGLFSYIGYAFGYWNIHGEILLVKIASWLDIFVFTYAISTKINYKNFTIDKTIKEEYTSTISQPKLVDSYFSLLKENTLEIKPLTLREIDILNLICEGLNNSEIGDRLFISKNTVKYHIKNIYIKAKVNSRESLKEKLSSNHECETTKNQIINIGG